ncbi:MAG: dihydroorotate dehydrogenase electron transfer subunit [Myxococcota bacterium]
MASATPLRVDAEVVSLADEGGVNHRLVLSVPGWPGSSPGQFVMLSAGVRTGVERSDPLLPRPMAVYRQQQAGGGTRVEILFKVHGRGTALLACARPGEKVRVVGPLGRGFPLGEEGEAPILVAGGTGIASVYELAAALAQAGRPARVLLGARSADDLMAEADFAALPGALRVATEDGSRGERGLVTDLLAAALAEAPNPRVYACGPTPMMRATADLTAAAGVPCIVSLENPMACGFGVCLGCAAPLRAGGFALVCRDGPVFDAARVDWEGLP